MWGRRIAVLGLAFKPNTSDVREAAALYLCRELVAAGATLRAFDPAALEEAARATADLSLELSTVRSLMAGSVLVDARNVLDPSQARAAGFHYLCTGREASTSNYPPEPSTAPEMPLATPRELPVVPDGHSGVTPRGQLLTISRATARVSTLDAAARRSALDDSMNNRCHTARLTSAHRT